MKKTRIPALKIKISLALWMAGICLIHTDAKADTPSTADAKGQDPAKRYRALEVDLRADALFWTASQPGLAFVTLSDTISSYVTNVGKVSMKTPSFDWDVGFRTALGFTLGERRWDTQLIYTWFHDRANGQAANGSSSLLPLFTSASSNAQANQANLLPHEATHARADWDLYLNIIDWELGKNFIPMKWFSFRPYIGIKAAWIHQRYDIDYTGYKTLSSAQASDLHLKMKNNFWGVGPACGFASQFWLAMGLSIYGNASLSGLYGKFLVAHKEVEQAQLQPTLVTDASIDNYSASSTCDLQLGLRWDSNVCKNKKAGKCQCPDLIGKMNFSLAAGWEQHIFFSQGRFFRFNDPSNGGNFTQDNTNLSVQGMTISARVDF